MKNEQIIKKMTTRELADFLISASCGAVKMTACEEACETCERTNAECVEMCKTWLEEEERL